MKRESPTIEIKQDGRVRAVIESLSPQLDGGRFPVKRIVGDLVEVEADCFTDGHDVLRCMLQWRRGGESEWKESAMRPVGNDRWCGSFSVDSLGSYEYTVTAWIDHFHSWRHEFARRSEPDDVQVAALVGAQLAEQTASRAEGADGKLLLEWAAQLRSQSPVALKAIGLDETMAALMMRYPDRAFASAHAPLSLWVDRARARCSAWYEFFPRSAGRPGTHGTLRDAIQRLSYVEKLGFNVLYLPPIHPIGQTYRKGKNNALTASEEDVGSPWAIGAKEGGHKAIHPQLGDFKDFDDLVKGAKQRGMEIALDIAFQCSPDHPYVREHPQWFRARPDGSIQYAENPPKKYQDIYPFDFETEDWEALWQELRSVFAFWIEKGVKIFRVDNPHTKAFPFWEWCIADIKREYPEVLFLAEAFTRPRVMHRLAKLGFSQSYTYFSWRNTKEELTDYFTELTRGPGRDYFRPNVWPNTPDILTEHLQYGGRAAFVSRLVLAATLCPNYGIYGPAYEHMDGKARDPGGEEYLDSEKYQLRHWDLDRADSLAPLITRINDIRRDNAALHSDGSLRFLPVDNEQIIAYAKQSEDGDNLIIAVVNLDPHHTQSGWVDLELPGLQLDEKANYQMHELLSGARYLWHGRRNYISLDPARSPAHVFRLRKRVRTEHDFDYFL
ncbi:MAG TPA: alpha-1,4-glucan--maltose-1-phosphate maltosyltransferase [Burkholderiales bacterium]|nr:alpha-1,4-glucan--maltose-1-phosphate maltosyltransferase [Burkholderiales bacterium]